MTAPGRATLHARIRGFAVRGLSKREVLLTVLTGVFVAVFPVLGVTALFCAAIAQRFRLNHLLIQAVNAAALPLQLALFVPFVRLGEKAFGLGGSLPTSVGGMVSILAERPLEIFGLFFEATLAALAGWMLTGLPLLALALAALSRPAPELPEKARKAPPRPEAG